MRISQWLEEVQLEARLAYCLLEAATGLSRAEQILASERTLSAMQVNSLNAWCAELSNGKPLAYVMGYEDFYGLRFLVSADVLIPRADTECVVEEALIRCSEKLTGQKPLKILDLGCGSGCIAVCLAKTIHNAHIVAVDISDAALHIAQINAKLHELHQRIQWVQSDGFSALSEKNFDVIVSNPPYLSSNDSHWKDLTAEPHLALWAGEDGLHMYRILATQCSDYLKSNAYLIIEHGYQQQNQIVDLFAQQKKWELCKCGVDLQNNPRFIVFKKC